MPPIFTHTSERVRRMLGREVRGPISGPYDPRPLGPYPFPQSIESTPNLEYRDTHRRLSTGINLSQPRISDPSVGRQADPQWSGSTSSLSTTTTQPVSNNHIRPLYKPSRNSEPHPAFVPRAPGGVPGPHGPTPPKPSSGPDRPHGRRIASSRARFPSSPAVATEYIPETQEIAYHTYDPIPDLERDAPSITDAPSATVTPVAEIVPSSSTFILIATFFAHYNRLQRLRDREAELRRRYEGTLMPVAEELLGEERVEWEAISFKPAMDSLESRRSSEHGIQNIIDMVRQWIVGAEVRVKALEAREARSESASLVGEEDASGCGCNIGVDPALLGYLEVPTQEGAVAAHARDDSDGSSVSGTSDDQAALSAATASSSRSTSFGSFQSPDDDYDPDPDHSSTTADEEDAFKTLLFSILISHLHHLNILRHGEAKLRIRNRLIAVKRSFLTQFSRIEDMGYTEAKRTIETLEGKDVPRVPVWALRTMIIVVINKLEETRRSIATLRAERDVLEMVRGREVAEVGEEDHDGEEHKEGNEIEYKTDDGDDDGYESDDEGEDCPLLGKFRDR